MTEEIKADVVVEEVVEEVVEVSPVELEAREQGWVSKDEWEASGRDVNEWRPAKEFKERGELFKSIHSTKRELQQAKAALDSLARHHQHVYQKSYQDALKTLKLEKRAAIRNEDFEALDEIETDIEKLQATHNQDMAKFQAEQAAARQVGAPPELEAWMHRNQWYSTDSVLRDEADAAGFIYLNKGGSREGLLDHVEKKMRQKFPEKFGVKRAAPNAVSSVDRTSKAPRGAAVELTELETKIMNDLVKGGVMTKEQYIKELKGKG